MNLEKELNIIENYKSFLEDSENLEFRDRFNNLITDYEYLYKKYSNSVEMMRSFIDTSMEEYKQYKEEKTKRNKTFINYKKRIYEELQKLKEHLHQDEEIISTYKMKIKELSNENLILKHKFRHLSSMFKHKKENDLLNKYFPDKTVIEQALEKTINKALVEKVNINSVPLLYFRKYYLTAIKDYLSLWIKKKIPSEKLSILLATIILKEFSFLIHIVISKFLLNKIADKNEKYKNFIEQIIKLDLIDEKTNQTFKHLEIKDEYNKTLSPDSIFRIIHKFKELNIEENSIHDLSIKLEIDELEEDKILIETNLFDVNSTLEELEQEENDTLISISQTKVEEELCELKSNLNTITNKKNETQNEIFKLHKEISNISHKIEFLTPLVAQIEKKDNSMEEKEKKIKQKYNNLILFLASALEESKN